MSRKHGKTDRHQKSGTDGVTKSPDSSLEVARGQVPPSAQRAAAARAIVGTASGAAADHPPALVAAADGIVTVPPGAAFDLAGVDPDADGGLDKDWAKGALATERARIQALQEKLYAERRNSLLVVFQAIDTGGKDGTIRAVLEGVNPQGCSVAAFKVPSSEELDHDFLWRYHKRTPGRGMIGVFNRSHYEDVLVVRVKNLVPEPVWQARYDLINDFERLLTASGTRVLKFFLHISKDEQKARLEARIADPDKHWKFDPADLVERRSWDAYQEAFSDALRRCSTPHAPWHVVPADRKWFRNLVVARTIADTLEAMGPRFPQAVAGVSGLVVPD